MCGFLIAPIHKIADTELTSISHKRQEGATYLQLVCSTINLKRGVMT